MNYALSQGRLDISFHIFSSISLMYSCREYFVPQSMQRRQIVRQPITNFKVPLHSLHFIIKTLIDLMNCNSLWSCHRVTLFSVIPTCSESFFIREGLRTSRNDKENICKPFLTFTPCALGTGFLTKKINTPGFSSMW